MDNNRKQQCTTVAPSSRRLLQHAPLVLLLVASGPCFAADGDPEAGRVNEFAGTHGAPDAVPRGAQPTVVSIQIAQAEVPPPPHAPTPIAQASDASMQIA